MRLLCLKTTSLRSPAANVYGAFLRSNAEAKAAHQKSVFFYTVTDCFMFTEEPLFLWADQCFSIFVQPRPEPGQALLKFISPHCSPTAEVFGPLLPG